MKKKISYVAGTIVSLIASIFSSATASACGGDMNAMPPESYKDTKSYSDGKTYMDTKPYMDDKSNPNMLYVDTKPYMDDKSNTTPYVDPNPYQDTKSNAQIDTYTNGKTTVTVSSYNLDKHPKHSKILIDGVEVGY